MEADLAHLHQLAEGNPAALRFRQGDGPVVDLDGLVRTIRTDQPVALVEPTTAALRWSEPAARQWAADAVAAVVTIAGDPEDAGTLHFAIATARQYADGTIDAGILDNVFSELFAEEWPDYEPPYFDVVTAARQLTARDAVAATPAGAGVITPGTWAAAAATAAAAAAEADGDPASGRPLQATRLLAYLFGTAGK